jgi:hypothetical protein
MRIHIPGVNAYSDPDTVVKNCMNVRSNLLILLRSFVTLLSNNFSVHVVRWGCIYAHPPPFTIVTITDKVAVYAPAERAETLTLFHLYQSVLRIHDILVWIRIRGSMLLTKGSRFGSGPCCFRSSLTFNTPTKK